MLTVLILILLAPASYTQLSCLFDNVYCPVNVRAKTHAMIYASILDYRFNSHRNIEGALSFLPGYQMFWERNILVFQLRGALGGTHTRCNIVLNVSLSLV